jgi:hypothetical protein
MAGIEVYVYRSTSHETLFFCFISTCVCIVCVTRQIIEGLLGFKFVDTTSINNCLRIVSIVGIDCRL